MRTLFLYAPIFIFNLNIISQNKNDSTEFFRTYDNAYKLRNINADSAFYWIEKAQEIAQLSGKREWLGKTFNLKGILYYKKNEHLKSLTELEKALKYANDAELKGKIYINLGNALSDMGYNYSAIEYYKKSVRIFNETNNYQFLIRALMNLASEEFNVKQVTKARNHLKLALYYAQENNLTEEEAMCLNNLSAIFVKSGLIDSASRYIYQSFNAYEKVENYFGLADAYLTAIEMHLEKKEWHYAKALIDLADSLINSIQYLEGKKLLTSEKVNYYMHVNDIEKSVKYFNEYLKLEDGLNKKQREYENIKVPTENDTPKKQSDTNDFLRLEVFFIICLSLCIIIFIVKNYRYVKE